MNSQMNSKVRLVRCPRCRQLLPELADVPVYECGGCGAILQAKNRKKDTQGTGSLVHEADGAKKNGLDNVINLSTDVSDIDNIPKRSGSGLDLRQEGLGGLNQSDECHNSDVISCHENTGSSPDTSGNAEAEEDKSPLIQYGKDYHNELGGDDSEHTGDTSVSNKIISPPKLILNEDKSLLRVPGTYDNVSFTSTPRKEDKSRNLSENISDGGQNDPQNCKKELLVSTTFSRDLSLSDESSEYGDPSPVSGKDRDMDENLKNDSISTSPAEVTFLDTNPEDQIRKAQSSSIESDSPDNQMFPFSESINRAQEESLPCFQRVSSADTLEDIPRVYDRTDLGVTLRSSTAKHYYTSSCEETEGQVLSQHIRPSRRNFKDAEFSSTKGMPKQDELMVNHRRTSETELPPRAINYSENLSAKKHHTVKGNKWNRSEFQEPTRHSHPLSSTVTMESGEYLSRPPIYSKAPQPVRYGSSSSYEQRSLPERTIDPESDKMELLKMVYELQDQLNRAHLSKGMQHGKYSNRVATDEELLPAHSDLFAPKKERFPDLMYPRNPGRHDQDKYWLHQGKVPRMVFSGDATHFRNEVDCSCLHCYRHEWQHSAQLPRHAYYDEGQKLGRHAYYDEGQNLGRHAYYDEGQNMAYPRHVNHSPYRSASASPHHYKSSEFSWSHDTVSDGKSPNKYEVNKQQQAAKQQYFRPIAGGAPVISCYSCNEILQLPADFVLFKRRCHRLRCSACTVVLKFSLQNQNHLVEYNPEPSTPPPSEVGGCIETTKLASTSGAGGYQHGDPVSSSDDYRYSSYRSSTDMEQFIPAPPSVVFNETSDRQKKSAGNPSETKKYGQKPILHDSISSYNNSRESFELGGPSSKEYEPVNVFSEIEEVSPEGGSPLHRLMGYPSPSHLVYRYSPDV